jgi:hypothetical protein
MISSSIRCGMASRNHAASDGEPIRQEAASFAAPQVPGDSSADLTDAHCAEATARRFADPTEARLRNEQAHRRPPPE